MTPRGRGGNVTTGVERRTQHKYIPATDAEREEMLRTIGAASAAAEAAVMAKDLTGRGEVLVSTAVHPEYRQVIRTYTAPLGLRVTEIPYRHGLTDLDAVARALSPRTAAIIIQHPNFFGCLEDGAACAELAHRAGALLVCAVAEPLSLGILEPPGAWGADIVAGEGQPLGHHLNFGGPYLGMLATRQEIVRRIPGRLVGATMEAAGRRGFVLTPQTRAQR